MSKGGASKTFWAWAWISFGGVEAVRPDEEREGAGKSHPQNSVSITGKESIGCCAQKGKSTQNVSVPTSASLSTFYS